MDAESDLADVEWTTLIGETGKVTHMKFGGFYHYKYFGTVSRNIFQFVLGQGCISWGNSVLASPYCGSEAATRRSRELNAVGDYSSMFQYSLPVAV